MYCRKLTRHDLPSVVLLHKRAFSDYFSTALGDRYLSLLYGTLIATPGSVAVGAFSGGRLLALAAGYEQREAFLSRFFSQQFWTLAGIVVRRCSTSLRLQRQLIARAGAAPALLSRVITRRQSGPQVSICPSRLLSIAVDPDCRGQGVGKEVEREFCRCMADMGVTLIGLSVHAVNAAAIRFYAKTGWRPEKNTDRDLYFLKSLTTSGS